MGPKAGCLQRKTYKNFFPGRIFRRIFKVHSDQVLGKATVIDFIDAVQHEIDEVET